MTEKEKQVQNALGTMKRQMFVQTNWNGINGMVEEFERALKNFGLFMYEDPNWKGTDQYGFIVSNEKLTDEQIVELCECYIGDEDDGE